MEPYEALFDRHSNLVAWLESNQYIFNVNLQWVAYANNGYVWNLNEKWIGYINNLTLFDRQGRVVAWSPRYPIGSISGGNLSKEEPLHEPRPLKPERPLTLEAPLKPTRPNTPYSGWSPLSFNSWIEG